jgi:hypothetical protein
MQTMEHRQEGMQERAKMMLALSGDMLHVQLNDMGWQLFIIACYNSRERERERERV